MPIIRNLLILCLLMCGLLFGAQQFSAGIGKGDVLAYQACRDGIYRCTPKLLDMRTLARVEFGSQNLSNIVNMFWTENGHLYMLVQGAMGADIYQWNGGSLRHLVSVPSNNMYLIYNENNRFAFYIGTARQWSLLVWNGAQLIEFTPPFGGNLYPVWAADGRFAFTSTKNNNTELYVSDGLTLTNLGQFDEVFPFPTWSADGRLAFISERDGNSEIYVWDGTVLTNISQHEAHDNNPTWGPDGQLAFTSERDGNSEIYLWDGVALTNISQTPADEYNPQWSADGRLAFATSSGVYVLGESGLRFAVEGIYSGFQWISQGRLLIRLGVGVDSVLWSDEGTIELLTEDVIEYGDGEIAFVSHRYRAGGVLKLYVLEGANIIATGLESRSGLGFKSDGKGGLLGIACAESVTNCDLYHWEEGHIHQLTNTPSINEKGPFLRP
jgi:WD40-like Beta Propeller Repeat